MAYFVTAERIILRKSTDTSRLVCLSLTSAANMFYELYTSSPHTLMKIIDLTPSNESYCMATSRLYTGTSTKYLILRDKERTNQTYIEINSQWFIARRVRLKECLMLVMRHTYASKDAWRIRPSRTKLKLHVMPSLEIQLSSSFTY